MATPPPVAPVPENSPPVAGVASTTDPSLAEEATLSASTQVNTMADLRKKAPQVYKAMMEGIAMNICNDMQDAQGRLKALMDEYNRP